MELFEWWTGSVTQWLLIGTLCGLGSVIALGLLIGGNVGDAWERAADDADQADAVSRPAALQEESDEEMRVDYTQPKD